MSAVDVCVALLTVAGLLAVSGHPFVCAAYVAGWALLASSLGAMQSRFAEIVKECEQDAEATNEST